MELIGNVDIVSQLNIARISAERENRAIPHMIFCGAPGCGKTSMAKRLSELTGCELLIIAADSLKVRDDAVDLMSRFNRTGYNLITGNKIKTIKSRPTLLFIDEIHNLSLTAQENLGILMEEWYIPVTNKQVMIDGLKRLQELIIEGHKSIFNRYLPISKLKPKDDYQRWSPQFTLIGATTNDGKLSKPFRDRFKLRFSFNTYSYEESILILKAHAQRMNLQITDDAIIAIAQRGRGIPRILVRLLEQCRDAAITSELLEITKEITIMVFALGGIDRNGLTKTDIELMKALFESQSPLGIDNLAIRLNENPKVVLETIEPYLIQKGLITRAPKGRGLTIAGLEYLFKYGHIEPNKDELEFSDIPMSAKRIA